MNIKKIDKISTPIPTATPESFNSNSNSNSGSFNSNSSKSLGYQLQLQIQLPRFQLQFQLQLRSWSWTQLQLQLRSWPQPWTSWSIACRRCSNYIFILDLTHGFIGLSKDNCKTRRETFRFGDLVRLILDILR